MKHILFVLLFISNFSFFSFSQKALINQIKEVEENLLPVNVFEGEPAYNLEERMKFYDVPGMSITVIKDYKILWTKHYGVTDKDLQTPVTDKTYFSIGSLSKGVASLTVLSLVEKGIIDLNEDVNKYLSSWKIPENEFTKQAKVTPALLMNHTGGVMHGYGTEYTRDNFPTITQFLAGESPAVRRPTLIDRVPGTEFLYSNPGYAILQQLVEDVTGTAFYETAKKNVLSKIGMNNSTFHQPLPLDWDKFASSGHRSGKPLANKHNFYPNVTAGGLWTTSSDYAKYVIELQKSFHGKSNKVISQDLTKEMLKSHVAEIYGYGVFFRQMKDEKYFGHMGDNSGFFAGFLSHMSDGNGVVILTNSRQGAELIREINKSVANVYKWKGMTPDVLKIVELSNDKKKMFAGKYKAGEDEALNIVMKDNELYIENYSNAKLFHIGDNTFKIKRRAGEIKFFEKDGDIYAEFIFADELQRFLNKKRIVRKMAAGEKLPYELLTEGNFEAAKKMYRDIFTKDEKNASVSENRLNRMGYQFIGKKKLQQALCVFELNIEFYPNSSNVYDSYGEALMLAGRKEESLKNYRKVLELNPDSPNAKAMIKKIKSKQ